MNDEPNEINSVNNDNPILDIVSSIQNKLNKSTIEQNNVQPIFNENAKKKDLSGLDISKMLEMLNSAGIVNEKKENINTPTPCSSSSNIDIGSIMKFQKAFSGLNQADPRKDLLSSLKPFLRETRQKNIDTYITILGVMKAFNIFSGKDRD